MNSQKLKVFIIGLLLFARLFMKLLALWKFNLIPNPSAQAALSLQEKGT
jgi:hypothetical protein